MGNKITQRNRNNPNNVNENVSHPCANEDTKHNETSDEGELPLSNPEPRLNHLR